MILDYFTVVAILDKLGGDQFLYELNDQDLRQELLLQVAEAIGDLYPTASDFTITCDDELNPPELIDKNCMRFSIERLDTLATITMEPEPDSMSWGFVWRIEIDPPVTIISGLTC